MKKVIQKSMGIRKTAIFAIIILTTAFCCICTNADICGYYEIARTWKIHAQCTDNTSDLTSNANTRLQTKNQDDDYAVYVMITKGSTETGWHNITNDVNDDGKIYGSAELDSFLSAMQSSGKNSHRFVSCIASNNKYRGFRIDNTNLIAIMDEGHGGTLAHEIGHCKGLDENEEGKEHRIMNQCSTDPDKNTVNSAEKSKYETLE